MRRILRVILSFMLTCFFGLIGFVLYLLGGSSHPLHSLARLVGYLLIWPVFLIQYLGGSNPVHVGTSPDPVKILSWIGLWVYFYFIVAFGDRWSRKQ